MQIEQFDEYDKNGNIRMKILTITSLLYLVTLSVVSAEGTIDPKDNVAMTFWIATALMLASTVFSYWKDKTYLISGKHQ